MAMKAQSPADRRRTARRRKLVGADKVAAQEVRGAKGSVKAVAKGVLIPGRDVKTEVAKEKTRQVQKRMAEYRAGKRARDKVIDKVKVYKNPGNI